MAFDWAQLHRHISVTVTNCGRWVGLFDGDGNFLMEITAISELSAEDTRGQADSPLSMTVPTVTPTGDIHPVADVLIGEGVGRFDKTGQLAPDTDRRFLVMVATPERTSTYMVVSRVAEGGMDRPYQLTIEGVHIRSLLQLKPCPSHPPSWQARFDTWHEDAACRYVTPRVYAGVELATKATHYTVGGAPETVIRTVIQDSLDAVNTAYGWTDDPDMVVDWAESGHASPLSVTVRKNDGTLWDTVASVAANAGVNIDVRLRLPGDPPVTVRDGKNLVEKIFEKPIMVVDVLQGEVMV